MKKQAPFHLFVLVTICIVTMACGSSQIPVSNTAPTPTPEPLVKDGQWESDDGQAFPVSITITDGRIAYFRIKIDSECVVEYQGRINLHGNTLELGEINSQGVPFNDGILGTFNTPTTVTGSFANPYNCGNWEYGFPEGGTTWSAQWKSP